MSFFFFFSDLIYGLNFIFIFLAKYSACRYPLLVDLHVLFKIYTQFISSKCSSLWYTDHWSLKLIKQLAYKMQEHFCLIAYSTNTFCKSCSHYNLTEQQLSFFIPNTTWKENHVELIILIILFQSFLSSNIFK